MAAYIGDVLSYYTDTQLRESILEQAKEVNNVISIAQSLGYKPKLYSPSTTVLSVYQLVPAIGGAGSKIPDLRYALVIKEGMEISSTLNNDVVFSTKKIVDFSNSSSFFDNMEISVYQVDSSNDPERFLLKKSLL